MRRTRRGACACTAAAPPCLTQCAPAPHGREAQFSGDRKRPPIRSGRAPQPAPRMWLALSGGACPNAPIHQLTRPMTPFSEPWLDVFYAGLKLNPTRAPLRSAHAGLVSRLIHLVALSTTRRISAASYESLTDDPSPPSFPRLLKKVRRAMAAMHGAGAWVRSPLFVRGPPTGTGPTSTDGACCVHARGLVLVDSAFDTSDNMMLTSVVVISISVRAELACSAASATACPR